MTRTLAIIGMGKMGQAISDLAPSRGWEVVARLGSAETARGITRDTLGDADVCVEFSTPRAAPANIRGVLAAGSPIVVGTTGWYDSMPGIRSDVAAHSGALLTAPNFSLGVNIFEQIVDVAARLLGRVPSFEAQIVETHHATKKDAPSGTAVTLQRTASAAWGRGNIPISSVRTGEVLGTHEFLFDSAFEQIHLEHVTRDRRVFAEGALVAAAWLIGRRGVFTMPDVLASSAAYSSDTTS